MCFGMRGGLHVGCLRLCWLFAGILLPAPVHAGVFYPVNYTLENGLQLIVVPNHLAPAVNQMVWYKVGSVDEMPGKTGLAHYLEHLMFRGTAMVAPGDFSKIIAAQGGDDNAFTSYDYTSFHETVAADRLSMIMQMEADRMQNLRIVPVTAAPELNVILNERQERTDNNPEGRFAERLRKTLMPHYPYGTPVIGWKQEIEKLSAADAIEFYGGHYAPNNAIVVISGDVVPEEVLKLANEIYGKLHTRNVPLPAKLPQTPLPASKRLVLIDKGVEQPQLEMEAIVPSYSTQKKSEAYAYEVLAAVLDSGEVGVLYQILVEQQNLASSVETSYDPDARGDAIFTIAATPSPGKDAIALEKALRLSLQKLAATGLDPARVQSAKKRMNREAIFARDGLMMPGYAFGMALATGHKVSDVEAWPERIQAVAIDDVNEALRVLVANPHTITGLLLPDPHATLKQRDLAYPTLNRNTGIR
jgi:zinc protease